MIQTPHPAGCGEQEAVLGWTGNSGKGRASLCRIFFPASLLKVSPGKIIAIRAEFLIPCSCPLEYFVIGIQICCIDSCFVYSYFKLFWVHVQWGKSEVQSIQIKGMKVLNIAFCMNMNFGLSDGGAKQSKRKNFLHRKIFLILSFLPLPSTISFPDSCLPSCIALNLP